MHIDIATLECITQSLYSYSFTVITIKQYKDLHGITEEIAAKPGKRLYLVPIRESAQPDHCEASLIADTFSTYCAGQVSQNLHIFALNEQRDTRAKRACQSEVETTSENCV